MNFCDRKSIFRGVIDKYSNKQKPYFENKLLYVQNSFSLAVYKKSVIPRRGVFFKIFRFLLRGTIFRIPRKIVVIANDTKIMGVAFTILKL
jgi:hypothetical protein